MGAPRRRHLVARRRRVDDEGEEEGSVGAGLEDDSLSEGSIISDAEDADAEGSDASDVGALEPVESATRAEQVPHPAAVNGKIQAPVKAVKQPSFSTTMTDTEAMMNGLKVSSDMDQIEEMHFDEMGQQQEISQVQQVPAAQDQSLSGKSESLAERRRREHEEYKKKKDADPAFVPNRGGFFMHDHRSAAPGQNGFRPFGRGRGRGRGYGDNPSLVGQTPHASDPADAPWAHDLHDTIVQPDTASAGLQGKTVNLSINGQPKTSSTVPRVIPNRSFSKSTRIGNVQVRVYLEGMQDPIVFSAVPVNQHTRLPHHRPPLRRDKPVRISLPDLPPRYIFPATDRSFIFIPRALRPNQQGFGRGRGRGSFGGYGGFQSRRTSAYGGSVYSPSIAMSRRSSLAREISREGIISPAGSSVSRAPTIPTQPGKPIVRLPPALDQPLNFNQQSADSNQTAPMFGFPQPQTYPLPQKPTFRENRPSSIPMHQPKPQKTVSVADIESPATLSFNPPQQQQQQPFHQQVPLQVNSHPYPPDPTNYPHSRHPSHPSQASGGTPLSQIPERAIHAQPFQPLPYQQSQAYYPQQYPPPLYYFPPPGPAVPPSVAAPSFIPGQQYPYVVPAPPPPPQSETSAPSGTVAHESNGMVYYYDSSQLTASAETAVAYPPAYAPPNAFIYPQPTVYYPPQ